MLPAIFGLEGTELTDAERSFFGSEPLRLHHFRP